MFVLSSPLDLIYSSMFFAFAAMYPNTQFLLYFIIPVKVKYLAWINGALYLYNIYQYISMGSYLGIVPIVVSLANFFIFYMSTRNYRRFSPKEFERRARFRKQMNEGKKQGNVTDFRGRTVITRHKCAICGRTELDDDNLEFRFCSKCNAITSIAWSIYLPMNMFRNNLLKFKRDRKIYMSISLRSIYKNVINNRDLHNSIPDF